MSDELRPAINVSEDAPKELSAEEFQRQLYTWFEDRGVLSELRAHLRMQMIGVLKDTAIGRSVTSQIKRAVSPKLQAINLLIAEFLLHQEYHYSLCVFSTEVPLVNVFPDFSNSIIQNTNGNGTDSKKWRFKQKDVWDILETFGILHDSQESKDISGMYYGNSDESLLTCIVRTLHLVKGISKPESSFDFNKNRDASDVWTIKNISELLSRANISKQHSCQIEEHLMLVLQTERDRIKEEQKEEYAKLSARLEEEASHRVEKYKRRVADIEKAFELERKKLEDELHRTKTSLKDCAETLHTRFEKLEDQERKLRCREKELKRKEQLVERNRMLLENEVQKVNCERYDIIQLKHELQKQFECKQKQMEGKYKQTEGKCTEGKQIGGIQTEGKQTEGKQTEDKQTEGKQTEGKQTEGRPNQFQQDKEYLKQLQEDCNQFKSDLKDAHETMSETIMKSKKDQVNRSQQTSDNSDVETALMKQLIRQLQNENTVLRNQNRDQQTRVQQLAQNANLLIRDLGQTEARSTSTFGANFRGTFQAVPLVVPSMPSLPVQPVVVTAVNPNGSGEECLENVFARPRAAPLVLGRQLTYDSVNVRPPVSPRYFRHTSLPRETRRRLLHRRHSNTSSSDEPSPTDEILQEARVRLRNLEHESEEIDRNFRDYRRRYRDNSPVIRDREIRDGGIRDGGIRDGGIRDGGIRDGGIRDGGIRDGGIRDGGIRDGGIRDGGIRDASLRDGILRDRVLRDVDQKGRDLRDRDLSGRDLRSSDLRGRDLRDRELRDRDHPLSQDSYLINRNRGGNPHFSMIDRYNITVNSLEENISRILLDRDRSPSGMNTFRMVHNNFPSTSTAVAFNLDCLSNLSVQNESASENLAASGNLASTGNLPSTRNLATTGNLATIGNLASPGNLASTGNLPTSTHPSPSKTMETPRTIKGREQNKLFYQTKNTEPLFQDKEKEKIYLDVMKILGTPTTSRSNEDDEAERHQEGDFNEEEHEIIEDEERENRASTELSGNTSGYLQDVLPGASGISFSSIDVSSDHPDDSIKKKDEETVNQKEEIGIELEESKPEGYRY